jgi:predicted DNA-binding transcriptional regulator AlpA
MVRPREDRTLATLKFTLAFVGIDIDDFDLLDRLVESLPDAHWGEVDGEVQADVYARDASLMEAVQHVAEVVRAVAPEARATRLTEDFVAVPDVAKRSDVNRETVRLWAKEANFPRPRGVVGNGIKIWDWSAVNSWLRHEHAGALGDRYRHPSPAETAQANTFLRQIDIHYAALETELKARPRAATGRWQQIPTVGISGTSSLRMSAGVSQPLASYEAVAG